MIKLDANKIMKGSPPPLEYQVTLENWRKYPYNICLLYTSPSPRDMRRSRMPSSA